MARVYPLYSSSKGNATFVGSSSAGILIDAGVSCKKLVEGLDVCGLSPDAVKAVFITHEHSDHIAGLCVFTKKYNIPVYAEEKTLDYIISGNYISPQCKVRVIDEKGTEAAGMKITSFSTPHDTRQSCGYSIFTSDSKKITICTDLGEITATVQKNLEGSDLVLLESNYDEQMLKNGAYPYMLKKRIMSPHGHLANCQCAAQVEKLLRTGTTRVILGHLSQENNTPQVAEKTVLEQLGDFTRNKDYILSVAPVCTAGAMCVL